MNRVFIGKNYNTNEKTYHTVENNLIIEARTRTGFFSTVIVPTLLENPGNIIIIENKREAYTLTKNYRNRIGHKTFEINKETSEEEIKNILLEDKFTIYIGIDILNFFNNESTVFYTRIFKKLLETIKENKINCLTIINEFPAIFSNHSYLLGYLCKHNKFVIRIQDMEQIAKLNIMLDNKIKIEDFDIATMDFNTDIITFKNEKYLKIPYFREKEYLKMLGML